MGKTEKKKNPTAFEKAVYEVAKKALGWEASGAFTVNTSDDSVPSHRIVSASGFAGRKDIDMDRKEPQLKEEGVAFIGKKIDTKHLQKF